MVMLKELINRVYEGKECISFEYELEAEDATVNAQFRRQENPLEWRMRIVLDRTRDADSQVYNFGYQLPKASMDLAMICAIGLKYFQLYLKEEVQKKSNIDFAIGDLVKDMVG